MIWKERSQKIAPIHWLLGQLTMDKGALAEAVLRHNQLVLVIPAALHSHQPQGEAIVVGGGLRILRTRASMRASGLAAF